jgi:RND superfamily putative drug exporter
MTLSALARLLVKRRVIAVIIWAILITGFTLLVPRFLDRLGGATFAVDGSQSQQMQQLLHKRFPDFPSEQDIVVFHSDTLTMRDETYHDLVNQTTRALRGKPHVAALLSPYEQGSEQQTSSDKHTSFIIVDLQGSDDELQKNSATLHNALPSPPSSMQLYLTGSSPLNADVVDQENRDIEHADMIGLPIAFGVLLLAFGTVVAAGLPLLLGTLGIAITFGILGVLSRFMGFDVFVESAVTMIGLALGIDYSLMMVTRFREELTQGATPFEAVMTTMKTAGRAVLFSGVTVLISLSGLLLVRSPLFRGLAIGTMTTVGVMLALSLTLLPIILSLLGRRINAFRLLGHGRGGENREQNFWARWAHSIMRRPLIIILSTTAILLALAWPAYNLRLGLNLGTDTLKDQASAQGLRLIEQNFSPGIVSPIQIVVYRDSGTFTSNDLSALASFHERLSQDGRVKTVRSLAQTLDATVGSHDIAALALASQVPLLLADQLNMTNGSNVTVVTVIPNVAADSQQSIQLFGDIKSRIVPEVTKNSDLHFGFIGSTAQIADLNVEVRRSVPIVLAFVLGLSFVLLAFSFRSLLLPLKAIVMNLLALSATFGLVAVVFQQGLGEGLLSFSSPGYIQNYLPLLTFVILFGLSMDYEVFLLSRIQEEWHRTHDNTKAVANGLEHTAKVITHAAAIMVVVFMSFLIAHMLEIKQLGFALATAVLIDATLIRLLLVPAAMRLMGKRNWWAPKWLRDRST